MKLGTKILLGVLGLGVLTCGGVIVTGFLVAREVVDWEPAAAELPKAKADYLAAGFVWTAKDLPQPSGGKDAEPTLRKAAAAFDGEAWKKVAVALRKDPSREGLAPFQRSIDLAFQASQADRWSPKRDWDLGTHLLFPELAKVRQLCQALATRAMLKAREGDGTAAKLDLEAGFRLARMMDDQASLLPYLSQAAALSLLRDAVCRSAAFTDEKGRKALASLRDAPDDFRDFERVMKYEAYTGLATYRNLYTLDANTVKIDPNKVIRKGSPGITPQRALISRHLQMWLEIDERMEANRKDPLSLSKSLRQWDQEMQKRQGFSQKLNKTMSPALVDATDVLLQREAKRRITHLYLQALLYRDKTGGPPNSLADLPGERKDPFGSELRYEREADGFRIWSIGRDQRDSGGATKAEDPNSDDATASYPPERKRAP
ncbi:hypothetical protein EON81_17100 [bacterium]|nr:MAG: hypothetical protein EON81_17100 [bacterium]